MFEKYFPYEEFRPGQREAVEFIYKVFTERRVGLLDAPCGIGKSIAVMTAFLTAREKGFSGTLMVLTRTRNEAEIYCRELKAVKEHSGVGFAAAIFKSKKEMCPLLEEDPRLREVGYRDFIAYCRGLKKGDFGRICPYYASTMETGWRPTRRALKFVKELAEVGPLMPEEVYEYSRGDGFCPYEVTRLIARFSVVIIGNYNYALVDSIRRSILGLAGLKTSSVDVVFDEAHALPRYASELLSDELSTRSLSIAISEAEKYNVKGVRLLEAARRVVERYGRRAEEKGFDEEMVVDGWEVVNELCGEAGLKNPSALEEELVELLEEGERIRAEKVDAGHAPTSYVSRAAGFFLDWMALRGEAYVNYAKAVKTSKGEVYWRLGIRCLDPSLPAGIIGKFRSALLMSGTLWNFDYYVDVLKLPKTRVITLSIPSPFPRGNRIILADVAVTTKYEMRSEEEWRKIAEHLEVLLRGIDGRLAVYFPSYDVMEEVLKRLHAGIEVLAESEATRVAEVLEFLRRRKRGALMGVAGGKLSEGVDLTMEGRSMLSAVIIVGLPYPKRTELQERLQRFFEGRFEGRGFSYAYEAPCIVNLAQTAGRLLRSPEDRGAIVIMDSRIRGRILEKLPRDWREDLQPYSDPKRIVEAIRSFMGWS